MSPVRSQPPGIERGGRGLVVEEIAFEDAGIAQQDLAVAVQLPLGVEQRQAAAAEAVMAVGLDEGDAAAFGQAVALRHRAADDVEEAQRLRRNRGAGAEPVTAAGEPEMALDVAEQQDVEQRVSRCGRARSSLPFCRRSDNLRPQAKQAFANRLPQPAALAEPEQEILLQLLVDAGNADEEGRRDLADVECDGIDRFRKADGAAQHELHHLGIAALGDMAERQIAHRFERLVGDPDRLGIDIRRIDQVAMRQHRALGRTCGA